MSDPQRRTVRVRRSPKVGVFLVLGAAAGAVVALVVALSTPPDPDLPTPQALGFLLLVLAPTGALIAGVVALLIDAVLAKRERTVEAERVPAGDRADD